MNRNNITELRPKLSPQLGGNSSSEREKKSNNIFIPLLWQLGEYANSTIQWKIESLYAIAKNNPIKGRQLRTKLAEMQGVDPEALPQLSHLNNFFNRSVSGKVVTHETAPPRSLGNIQIENLKYVENTYTIAPEYEVLAKDTAVLSRWLNGTSAIPVTEFMRGGKDHEDLPLMYYIAKQFVNKLLDKEGIPFSGKTIKRHEVIEQEKDIAENTQAKLFERFVKLGITSESSRRGLPKEIAIKEYKDLYRIINAFERFQQGDRTILEDAYMFEALLQQYPEVAYRFNRSLWTLDQHGKEIDKTKTFDYIKDILLLKIALQQEFTSIDALISTEMQHDPRTWSGLLYLLKEEKIEIEVRESQVYLQISQTRKKRKEQEEPKKKSYISKANLYRVEGMIQDNLRTKNHAPTLRELSQATGLAPSSIPIARAQVFKLNKQLREEYMAAAAKERAERPKSRKPRKSRKPYTRTVRIKTERNRERVREVMGKKIPYKQKLKETELSNASYLKVKKEIVQEQARNFISQSDETYETGPVPERIRNKMKEDIQNTIKLTGTQPLNAIKQLGKKLGLFPETVAYLAGVEFRKANQSF